MMERVDEQTAIMGALETYWKSRPELRWGQLIGIMADEWHQMGASDPFYMPDSKLFEILGKEIYGYGSND